MSKLPAKAIQSDYFYCRPLPKLPSEGLPLYYAVPMGHNMLKKKLKDMFVSAGLTEDINSISNHSLRATGISWLYENGVLEKLIMERSGHLSMSGIRSYERTTVEQQKQVSDILSKGKKPLEPVNSDKSAKSQDEKAVLAVNVAACSADEMKATDENKENAVATLPVNPSDILKHFSFNGVDGCTFNFYFRPSE